MDGVVVRPGASSPTQVEGQSLPRARSRDALELQHEIVEDERAHRDGRAVHLDADDPAEAQPRPETRPVLEREHGLGHRSQLPEVGPPSRTRDAAGPDANADLPCSVAPAAAPLEPRGVERGDESAPVQRGELLSGCRRDVGAVDRVVSSLILFRRQPAWRAKTSTVWESSIGAPIMLMYA